MHVEASQLDINDRHHALKFQLRTFHQRLRLQTLNQLFAQRQQDRRIARGIFQLRFRQLKIPVAQPFALVDSLVQITRSNSFESVAFFDVAGADELAGQQRVEQSAEVDAEIVLDKLRVKLRVVSDLDWPWGFEQATQRR